MMKNMVGIATMVKVTGASFQELGGEWQGLEKVAQEELVESPE